MKLSRLGLVGAHTITMSEDIWTHWVNIVINTLETRNIWTKILFSSKADMTTKARMKIKIQEDF